MMGTIEATSDTAMAASDTARAGVEQGNSIITTGIKAVEAVVNAIRSLPFPLNIAAGAITAGVIASLGIAIGGAFGGSQKLPAANEGTGTVFGDALARPIPVGGIALFVEPEARAPFTVHSYAGFAPRRERKSA